MAGTIARGMETVLIPERYNTETYFSKQHHLSSLLISLGETWSVASPVISAQVAERSVKSTIPITIMFAFDTVSEQNV